MELFMLIALLCLVATLMPDFIQNHLKLSRFFTNNKDARKLLEAKVAEARQKLEAERNAQHAGEYSRSVKILRAEENLNAMESKAKMFNYMSNVKQGSIDTIAFYVSKALLMLMLIVLTVRNRKNSVMIFEDSINLLPLGSLLSFPTGVPNAISVPVWAFSCKFTFRLVYQLIRQQFTPKVKR